MTPVIKIAFLIAIASVLFCSYAFALSLQEAKQQGAVGEQGSGYLGAVSAASPAVQALVNDINTKRKAHYSAIAKQNGTPLQAVEALAGKTAIAKTQPGHFYLDPASGWRRK